MLKEKMLDANMLVLFAMLAVCVMAWITGNYANEAFKCFMIALVNTFIMVEYDNRGEEESE